jgi:hypothetical protein
MLDQPMEAQEQLLDLILRIHFTVETTSSNRLLCSTLMQTFTSELKEHHLLIMIIGDHTDSGLDVIRII